MTCFETGFAALFDITLLAGWANILMAGVAVVAAIYAKKQLESAKSESRRATAYAAYENYLQLCFENQTFAYGDMKEITKNADEYSKYRWFIAKMLFSFEQVLEACKDDDKWKTTISHQLKRHQWHLCKSSSTARPEWSEELKDLLSFKD